MDFARVLHELTEYFADRGMRWAVVGGVAMAAYGFPRTTLDLDFLAERKDQDALVAHLEAEGYTTIHRSEGYSNHQHADVARGRVDFVYVAGETASRLFTAARRVRGPGGTTIPVPSPEHLAAMKVHALASDPARKALELRDIQHLLTLPGVDGASVREHFARRGMEEVWNEIHAEI